MITLITGVPGTGKTAFLVSELEKVAATGRKIFVDNIPGLTLEHYRAGKITEWQKGSWLHIDQYKRTSPAIAMEGKGDDSDDDDGDGNENWIPHPEIVKFADSGELRRLAFDDLGNPVGSVPYESHKGALLVIDEAQRHFRPRPSGSVVPDHVAALEVHRHQGLDIWLVTQRPGLIDSNVRSLVGRHIALRSTSLGRYKYEWPEVGDIESKMSRDTAARSRYKLPKHVFGLYKSAEVHTMQKHTMPTAAKALFLLVPLLGVLLFSSYKAVAGKSEAASAPHASNQASGAIKPANYVQPQSQTLPPGALAVPAEFGLQSYDAKGIDNRHPYDRHQFAIVGRLVSAKKDLFRFSVMENGQHAFYVSSSELEKAGYIVVPINDCSAKLIYKSHEFFVTCNAQPAQQVNFQPAPMMQPQSYQQPPQAPIILQPYP